MLGRGMEISACKFIQTDLAGSNPAPSAERRSRCCQNNSGVVSWLAAASFGRQGGIGIRSACKRAPSAERRGRGARGAISLLCGEPEFQISLKHVFRVRIPGWPQGGDQDVVGCREFLQFHVVTSLQSADKAGLNGWALLAFG